MIGTDVYRFFGAYALLMSSLAMTSTELGIPAPITIGYFAEETLARMSLLVDRALGEPL